MAVTDNKMMLVSNTMPDGGTTEYNYNYIEFNN